MKKTPPHIHAGNVRRAAQQLLNTDISACWTDQHSRFALEIKHLRDLLHRHHYATGEQRPRHFATTDWIDTLSQELIQHTRHCMRQLPPHTQKRLWEALTTESPA